MKQTIIAIVGPSGSGKTTLTYHIKEQTGIPYVVSWTTRPMREGEEDGREHWFTTPAHIPPRESMIAYTVFGEHDYWVTRADIRGAGEIMMYVIDEYGLMVLMEDYNNEYNIVPVLIKRDNLDVDKKRVERDKHRVRLEEGTYEYIITNNGSLEEFFAKGVEIVTKIQKQYGSTDK